MLGVISRSGGDSEPEEVVQLAGGKSSGIAMSVGVVSGYSR